MTPITYDLICGFDNSQTGECSVKDLYHGHMTSSSVEILPQ